MLESEYDLLTVQPLPSHYTDNNKNLSTVCVRIQRSTLT